MAHMTMEQASFSSGSYDQVKKMPYFSLKNDNDTAIVRIMEDDVANFELLTIHPVTSPNGKQLKISCLRTPREPIDKCPFCKSDNMKVQQKIYIKLIEYRFTPDGHVEATPKIWERSINYANDLKTKIDMYGPLSNLIFIVTRHGAAGDKTTSYSIEYAPPQKYPNDVYPKIPDAFDGYSILGSAVFEKTAAEMEAYLATGRFPLGNMNNTQPVQNSQIPQLNTAPVNEQFFKTPVPQSTTVYTGSPAMPQQPVQQPQYQQPAMQQPAMPNTMQDFETPFTSNNVNASPEVNQEPVIQRPNRYY